MKKEKKVYEIVKNILYDKASRFKKKHGEWLVLYAPRNQVIFMDTWNGKIAQAHNIEGGVLDDGYVDCQLNGRVHTSIGMCNDQYYGDLESAVDIYKTLLPII